MTSCALRNVPENQYLLNKSKIKADKSFLASELTPFVKQKPNRKLLFYFRFHLGVYNLGTYGNKETKFKNWLKNTVGEGPVIYDSLLTVRSTQQMELYLFDQGYFAADVKPKIIKKNRKICVDYEVNSGIESFIGSIKYNIKDSLIYPTIFSTIEQRYFNTGEQYKAENLRLERERMTELMRRAGYYYFNSSYIYFDLDTTTKKNVVNVTITIDNHKTKGTEANDTIVESQHEIYYINNISINTQFNPLSRLGQNRSDTVLFDNYSLLYPQNSNLLFKKQRLVQHIFFSKGDRYNSKDVDDTYKRIAGLKQFRFINIISTPDQVGDKAVLNMDINLTPAVKQDYGIELIGTNNGGNLGIGTKLNYRNKNLFRGMEQLSVSLFAGFENLPEVSDTLDTRQVDFLIFNTLEISPSVNIEFPRLLLPFGLSNVRNENTSNTIVNGTYSYETVPEFSRSLTSFSFGYSWRTVERHKHAVFPVDISFIKNKLTSAFATYLKNLNNPTVSSTYQDQFVASSRYQYVYNNLDAKKTKSDLYIRTGIQVAGNGLSLLSPLLNLEKESDYYRIGGIRFAQFIRPEVEVVFSRKLLRKTRLVNRLYAAAGISYGNAIVLPYEKNFFAGGANDIRAWQPRTLGPGSFKNTTTVEQFGEFKITYNMEYRFPLIGIFESAFFTDVGNIWMLSQDILRDGSTFSSEFFKELGVGSGVGLRLNMNYFIIRLDGAIKILNPTNEIGDRFVLDRTKWNDMRVNFAIGYPF